ncbi:hypothetical protein ACTQ4E_16200 [Lawsonibacter sp. LCP25S3_G6]|uniref:hypothetical protein n=1 Tax=unclassified Lawsonibacter TaxID=2617946 RepID=UPI003F989A9D
MNKDLFVQTVRIICLRKGIRPTNACKEAGVGGSFLSDINRGQTPSVTKVQMLAKYLGVPTSTLLGEKIRPLSKDDDLTQAEQALMDEFRKLTPDQQDMVVRMVRAAAEKQ